MSKNLLFFWAGTVAAGYFAGRYSAPESIEKKSDTTAVVAAKSNEEKVVAVDRVVREVFRKDGTLAAKTTRSKARKQSLNISSMESVSQTREQTRIENRRGVFVSILVGAPLTNMLQGPVYGAQFSKQFLGPFALGAWAFTDLRAGLSIGMEF